MVIILDDDLNFTDEPTLDKVIAQHNSQKNKDESNPLVSVQVPAFPTEHTPSMNPIEISVSTFHPGPTINLTDDPDSDEESNNNKSSQKSPVSILRTYRVQEADMISRISMSDSATRISSLETEISTMDKTFRDEIGKLQSQAAQQAHAQLEHGTILSEILSTLMKTNLASLIDKQTPERSGGSPTKLGKLKEDNIRQGIQKWEFDIFGMAETNLDWRMLSELEKLPHRTKEWWEHQLISWANNQTFPPRQARQYGGTALLSINKAAHRVIQKGSDNYNLGRLSWTRYKGKGKHTLRIIVAYRPNPP